MFNRSIENALSLFPKVRVVIVLTIIFFGIVIEKGVINFDILYALYYSVLVTLALTLIWHAINGALAIFSNLAWLRHLNLNRDFIRFVTLEILSFHFSVIGAVAFFILPGKSAGMSFSSYGPGGVAHIVNGSFTLEGLQSAQLLVLNWYLTATIICTVCLTVILILTNLKKGEQNG